MRNHQTNKPFRNFQKKKYYTNRNIFNKKEKLRIEYYFDTQTRE
jgi:hypothetical protein